MSLDFVAEVWEILREHIDLGSRQDAADSLVNLLIDNNYEVDEIKDAFRDKDINTSLKDYAEEFTDEEESYEYEEDQDEWN